MDTESTIGLIKMTNGRQHRIGNIEPMIISVSEYENCMMNMSEERLYLITTLLS